VIDHHRTSTSRAFHNLNFLLHCSTIWQTLYSLAGFILQRDLSPQYTHRLISQYLARFIICIFSSSVEATQSDKTLMAYILAWFILLRELAIYTCTSYLLTRFIIRNFFVMTVGLQSERHKTFSVIHIITWLAITVHIYLRPFSVFHKFSILIHYAHAYVMVTNRLHNVSWFSSHPSMTQGDLPIG
jgi:hypothetical protein